MGLLKHKAGREAGRQPLAAKLLLKEFNLPRTCTRIAYSPFIPSLTKANRMWVSELLLEAAAKPEVAGWLSSAMRS